LGEICNGPTVFGGKHHITDSPLAPLQKNETLCYNGGVIYVELQMGREEQTEEVSCENLH